MSGLILPRHGLIWCSGSNFRHLFSLSPHHHRPSSFPCLCLSRFPLTFPHLPNPTPRDSEPPVHRLESPTVVYPTALTLPPHRLTKQSKFDMFARSLAIAASVALFSQGQCALVSSPVVVGLRHSPSPSARACHRPVGWLASPSSLLPFLLYT